MLSFQNENTAPLGRETLAKMKPGFGRPRRNQDLERFSLDVGHVSRGGLWKKKRHLEFALDILTCVALEGAYGYMLSCLSEDG